MARIQSSDGIRVDGLAELSRALKGMDTGLAKELRTANKDVAKFVADDAKSAAYSIGGVAAHVAPSVKASAGMAFAGVAIGGGAYPMAAGAEFGGQGRPTTQQFRPHLGTTGYFLYPTIRRDSARIEDEYGDALDRLIEKAGLK